MNGATTRAACACGSVELEATGAPILCVACHCDDCQEGSRRIEALPGAGPVRDQDGGSAYVLYRKDRIVCSKGASHLQRFKLSEGSVTNRAVATCCNSAMFVDFDKGPFWLSVYRSRLQGDPPPLQMRICMNVRPADRDGIPSYRGRPLSFVAKLLGSGTAMLLRR